jgi:CRISPR-associated protein Cas1
MMEEFRPALVDAVVVSLINTDQITAASFERTSNPKLPVRLNEAAMDLVIQAYEQQLSRRVHHTAGNGRTSQRRVIELQVRRLAHVVQGQAKQYTPYRWTNGQDGAE